MESGIFAILGAFFAGGGLATMTGRHQAAAKILQRWGPPTGPISIDAKSLARFLLVAGGLFVIAGLAMIIFAVATAPTL